MANILTATEAANVLRVDEDDANMLDLLDAVDYHVRMATGRDWAGDDPVHPLAKSAARMLLVRMHEDPGGMGAGAGMSLAVSSALVQLESIRGRYVEFEGLSGAGYVAIEQAHEGDLVSSLVGITSGYTGDQSSLFESVISEDGYLYQSSATDLDGVFFRVEITPLSDQ